MKNYNNSDPLPHTIQMTQNKKRKIFKKVRAFYQQAMRLLVEDPEACIAWCQRLALLHPHHPDVYRLQGEAYLALDDLDSADLCFDRALLVAPYNERALWNKGYCLFLITGGQAGQEIMEQAIRKGYGRRQPNRFGKLWALSGWMVVMLCQEWLPELSDAVFSFDNPLLNL